MEGVEICSNPKPGYKNATDFSSLTLSDVATESGFKWNFCVSVQKQDVSTLLNLDPSTLPFTTTTVCVDKSKANEHLEDLSFGFYYDNLKECSVDKIKTLKDAANASSDMQTLPEYGACETALPLFFKEPKKIATIVAEQNFSREIPPGQVAIGANESSQRSITETPELHCKR